MGLGTSKLKEELACSKGEADKWRAEAESLSAEAAALHSKLQLREREALDAAQRSGEELAQAVKQRQLAEEMRRSDALLVKRVTSMMLRQQHANDGAAAAQGAAAETSSYMAAELARATTDEQLLRQVSA
jgi:hypothetical protein|tara:strand:+ start:486 stop:875 length:390 start_codon:yes stop_codon:yes gene_type:complete